MLALLIAWIVISFILLSFGVMFSSFYNSVFNRDEKYNLVDTFIIGIIFIIIPLSASSLFFPSNHYVMAICIIISVLYWILNRKKFTENIKKIKLSFSNLKRSQIILFIVLIISFLTYILWSEMVFDSAFYHYQNIRWNEEYPAIPGLGNIEDRFAFNSNYFLVSAVFTFKFLFNESIYVFQSVLFLYVLLWACFETIKYKFDISRIALLIFVFIFFFINNDGLTDTSTDILPNICIFYYICRFTLYPNLLKKNLLLAILLPVTLVTFKLSVIPFCFISLFLFLLLMKNRKYKLVFFFMLTSFLVIGLWTTRNVIISGYLVYPFPEIDLFDFDWKMPKVIAELQRYYIIEYAQGFFKFAYISGFFSGEMGIDVNSNKLTVIRYALVNVMYLFVILSPIIVVISLWKKNRLHNSLYVLYGVSLLCIIYWFFSAPDFRFALGFIIGLVFLTFHITLSTFFYRKNKVIYQIGSSVLILVVFLMLFMSINRTVNYIKLLTLIPPSDERPRLEIAFREPYSAKFQRVVRGKPTGYTEYETNHVIIYIPQEGNGLGFDKLPSAQSISSIVGRTGKLQKIETIEARGSTIRCGFRTKKEYEKIIGIEGDIVIRKYYKK